MGFSEGFGLGNDQLSQTTSWCVKCFQMFLLSLVLRNEQPSNPTFASSSLHLMSIYVKFYTEKSDWNGGRRDSLVESFHIWLRMPQPARGRNDGGVVTTLRPRRSANGTDWEDRMFHDGVGKEQKKWSTAWILHVRNLSVDVLESWEFIWLPCRF